MTQQLYFMLLRKIDKTQIRDCFRVQNPEGENRPLLFIGHFELYRLALGVELIASRLLNVFSRRKMLHRDTVSAQRKVQCLVLRDHDRLIGQSPVRNIRKEAVSGAQSMFIKARFGIVCRAFLSAFRLLSGCFTADESGKSVLIDRSVIRHDPVFDLQRSGISQFLFQCIALSGDRSISGSSATSCSRYALCASSCLCAPGRYLSAPSRRVLIIRIQ